MDAYSGSNARQRQKPSLRDIEDILDDQHATAHDLGVAAEQLEKLLGILSFKDYFFEEFKPHQELDSYSLKEHAIYSQLMKLRDAGARLVTVNYDNLIEIANRLSAIDWTSADINNFFRSRDPVHDRLVLHLHGRWNNPRSVVFGTTTYDAIVGRRSGN
jgi:hypothetical protein